MEKNRRNFLKSDRAEYKYILEEFIRIALAHPDISFSLINNEKEQYKLSKGTLRQRLVNLFGKNYNSRLVPVNEKTDKLIATMLGTMVPSIAAI